MSSETANASLASPPPSTLVSKKVSPSSTTDIRATKKRKAESGAEGSAEPACAPADAKRAAMRVYLLDVAGAVQIQVREDNSLFELMDTICTTWLDKDERPEDGGIYDHLWQIEFAGKTHCGAHAFDELGVPETEEKSTALSELALTPGTSKFRVTYDFGSSTHFQIRVLSCSTVDAGANSAKKFPCKAPTRPADAPFLTASEIAASVSHRTLLETTPETEFSRRQERVIKAQHRPWSMREQKALSLVSMSGRKFTAAWKELMQHTLLFRSKSTASQVPRTVRINSDEIAATTHNHHVSLHNTLLID